MIHVLNYEENIIEDLSFKQDAIYEAEHNLNVQDMMETFDFTVASKIASNLRDRNRVIIQDHMGLYREFIVEMITDLEDGTTEIQSNASYLADITTAKPLKPKVFTNEMPTVILDYILADTGWEVSDDSEVPGDFTIEWDKVIDRAEALKILQEETDMRLTYFIETSGNKVDKRYVSIKKVDPLFNGEEIVYEDNLIGLKREIDFSEVATALLGVGPEQSDGNGKEKERLYVEVVDDKAQEQFGLPQRYIWDYYEVPTESDEKVTDKLLRQRAKKELDERKKASVVYEVSSNDINAQVGDMIRVKDEHIIPEVYLEAEIVEINYNLLSKTKEYKFGILREFTRDQVYSQFNKFREELERRLKEVISNTDSIISERLEEELKYVERYIEKSPTPPLNPKEGQLWLDTSHDGVAVLKRYENGEWIKSSVDDVKDIGGMTREETMYEALKERSVRNEVDYSEVFKRHGALVSEKHYHYVDEDIKNDLTNRYNALQQSYDDFKIAFNNINAEQPTIGLITTAISRAVEFEARLKEYNDSYYVARKSFDEVIALLQSQYSDEKYNELLNDIADSVGGTVNDDGSIDMTEEIKRRNDEALKMIADAIGGTIDESGNIDTTEVDRQRLDEAMELVANAIDGEWNGSQLIADIPNREELDSLNQSLKQYLNGELSDLDGKLGKQIETVVNQAKDEFSVAIDSVEKKVDGIEVGGRNLLLKSELDDTVAKRVFTEINPYEYFLPNEQLENKQPFLFNIELEAGKYIISGKFKAPSTDYELKKGMFRVSTASRGSIEYISLNNFREDNSEEYVHFSIPVEMKVKEKLGLQVYTHNWTTDPLPWFYIKELQVEKGNTPTDWSPAPEDYDNKINNLTQEVSKNTTSINLLENEISLKADSDTVKQILDDELEPIQSSVQTNQAELKVQSDLIGSKVDSNQYEVDKDGIVKDIETNASAIKQTSNSLTSNIDSVNKRIDEQKSVIDTNKSSISQLNNQIALKVDSEYVKQTLDDELEVVKSDIGLNKSQLQILENQISSKVESYEYTKDRNDIINDISTTKSEVKQLSDSFNVEIDSVNKKIDGLEIGGRNLLRYSTQKYLEIPNSYCTGIVEEEGKRALLFDSSNNILFLGGRESYLEKGKTYTFSFYAKASEELEFTRGIYINAGNSGFIPDTKITTDWERYSFTFTASNDDSVGIHMYPAIKNADGTYKSFYITDWQLEKGTVATDVTPAPEDVDSEINNLSQEVTKNSTSLNVLENEISLKADSDTVKQILDSELNAVKSNVQTNQSELKVLSNQISYKVEKSEYTTDMNGITRDINNTKSEINQLSDSVNSKITSVEQKFDDLEIGGTNLLRDSNNFSDNTWTSYQNGPLIITENVSVDEWGATDATQVYVGAGDRTSTLKVYKQITNSTSTVEGDIYTVSFYVKNVRDVPMSVNVNGITAPPVNIEPNEAKRVIFTGKRTTNHLQLQFRSYDNNFYAKFIVWRAKVEKGNKATDWTPAPEDYQSQIDNQGNILTKHESEIEQNKLGIGTKVGYTEMNGTNETLENLLTEFSQTADGFNFRIDSNGMIQDLTFDRNRFKLNSNLIEFNDGDVVIKDGVTTIKDAYIDKLFSKTAFIENLKAVDIDLNRATIHGGDSTNNIKLDHQSIMSYGAFTRSWGGETDTANLEIGLYDGQMRMRNLDTGYRLYLTERGLSTSMEGAIDEFTSGTLEFHSQRFNENSRGVTMHSSYGAVALVSDYSTAQIESNLTANIMSREASVYLRPMRDNRPGINDFRFWVKDNAHSVQTDGVLSYGDTNINQNSGIRFSRFTMGTPTVYATNGDGDIGTGNISVLDAEIRGHIRTAGRINFQQWNDRSAYNQIGVGAVNTYNSVVFASHSGGNAYFGVGYKELRVTNNNGYNGGNTVYRPIRASAFNQGSSLFYKTNIKNIENIGLDVVRDLTVVEYDLIEDIENGIENRKQLGFIAEYSESIATIDNKAIDVYRLSAYNTKAIQELAHENDELKSEIKELNNKLNKIMEMIK